jgi:hypothetical protein
MRRSAFALILILALPATAVAKRRVLAPPGNSSVNQYVESIPTAGGSQPTSSVHPHSGGGVGGGSGHSGGSGGSAGSGTTGGTTGGGAISAATQRRLAGHGRDGASAAALALATAPASSGSGNTGTGSSAANPALPRTAATSPTSAVLKALTGSSSSGGLGALLPIILIVSALGISAVAILRRRRAT